MKDIQDKHLFEGLSKRSAGILLPVFSLPSSQGIGCFGQETREFISGLKRAKIEYWQVCPFGPTGFGDSPYQTFSAFAGNPYFIDLQQLADLGLLETSDFAHLKNLPRDRVDYGTLYVEFWPLIEKAFDSFAKSKSNFCNKMENFKKMFHDFYKREYDWVYSYACFQSLKQFFNGLSCVQWPETYKNFNSAEQSGIFKTLANTIETHIFAQFVFFNQWNGIKKHAKGEGVKIIGDIPIFVGLDSSDVWANPEIFDLDEQQLPRFVAGVPPDYFSPNGQLWGNPLFKWDVLKKNGYKWWLARLRKHFECFDCVRLDHFRGFHDYWKIPANEKTAISGEWELGPGIDFFETVAKEFPSAKLIAEDLGDINENVILLLKKLGLPGMAILQFAFGGTSDNPYLLHNLSSNCVLYSGSHDNDTTIGWYNSADESTKDHVRRYFRVNGHEINWDFIRQLYSSVANLIIIPFQDILNLDSSARLNFPGNAQGNWVWRATHNQIENFICNQSNYLKELSILYGR